MPVSVVIIDNASTDEKSMLLAELNLSIEPAIGTPERTKLDALANSNTIDRVSTANAAADIANTAQETAEQLDNLEINLKRTLTNDTRASVVKATEMMENLESLPIGQKAEGYTEIRESMGILKGAMIDSVDSVYAGVTTSKGKERKEATLEQVNRLFKNYEDADDAQLLNIQKQTDWLVNSKKLNLLSTGEVIPLVEAITGGKIMSEVFWTEIINNQDSGDTILDTVADIYKLSEDQRGALDIKTFAKYIAGGGIVDDISDIPLNDEGRAKLFKNGFNFYKKITKDGKLGEMDDLDKGKASSAIINILNDSNSKDPDTAEQIMSWIKDPEMTEFLKTVEPKKAEAIKNMMITTAKDSARGSSGTIKKINSQTTIAKTIQFNVKSGMFELADGRSIADVKKTSGSQTAKQTKSILTNANRDVKVFLDNKDAHPALKDMTREQALHWFLKDGSGAVPLSDDVPVVGKLSAPKEDMVKQIAAEQSAAEWKATKEKIAFEASLPKQIATLKEEAKEARSTVGQDDSDLDEDEFKEKQRLELEAYNKTREARTK